MRIVTSLRILRQSMFVSVILFLSVNFSIFAQCKMKRCAKKKNNSWRRTRCTTRRWWISLKLTCQSQPPANDKSHTLSENTHLLLRIPLFPRTEAELRTDRSGFGSKDKDLGGRRERSSRLKTTKKKKTAASCKQRLLLERLWGWGECPLPDQEQPWRRAFPRAKVILADPLHPLHAEFRGGQNYTDTSDHFLPRLLAF